VGQTAPPLAAMLAWMGLISAGVYLMHRGEKEELPQPANPAEFKSALVFGAIYTVVLFATSAVRQHFGPTALYGVSALSGLADLDAITLSISRMVAQNGISAANAWQMILLGSLANLVFKGVMAACLGSWQLALRLALFFCLGLIGGLAILWFWPPGLSFGAKSMF